MATTTTRNLEVSDGREGNEDEGGGRNWRNKVFDLREAKEQIVIALPLIVAYVFIYSMTLVSVMFAGHLGELELAASTLANSWATVTGFGLMTGLSGALETLCGQAFGAKMYRQLGVYLQTSCIFSFIVCIIISILWLFTEQILVLLRQDPDVAKTAALYVKYLIPGLFPFGFVQNIMRFCQAQGITIPLVIFSGLPFGIHFAILYLLVHRATMGLKGAPLAASISIWMSLLMFVFYVLFSKKFDNTWKGLTFESFRYFFTILRLAVPSAAMVCLEYLAFEVLVILAGLMPNPKLNSSLVAICLNIEAIAYMIAYGLSASASIRVSNELGAGHPVRAKYAMDVALKLSFLLAAIAVLTIIFGHDVWVGFFTESSSMVKKFASMTALLAATIAIDIIQCILSGVARGCGWQHLAAWANLGCFYAIGLPISIVLGFKVKLYSKAPKPSSGPHKSRECLPLILILRNRLKYALTYREVIAILMQRHVMVDGKVRTDKTYPAGFMDVVSIPKTNEDFRLLYDTKGRFRLHAISGDETKFKLCKVRSVQFGQKGIPYLNTYDGRTIRYPDPLIKANDTIRLDLESNKIVDFIKFDVGNVVMVTGGRNRGRVGVIKSREKHKGSFETIHVQDAAGHEFATRLGNVFTIGKGTKPWVSLPKGKGIKLSIIEEARKRLAAQAAV
ncbi:hypothetical protein REPUB_Repub20aG0021800 [Reevesia pubescens]